jgi:hypothetical protein
MHQYPVFQPPNEQLPPPQYPRLDCAPPSSCHLLLWRLLLRLLAALQQRVDGVVSWCDEPKRSA